MPSLAVSLTIIPLVWRMRGTVRGPPRSALLAPAPQGAGRFRRITHASLVSFPPRALGGIRHGLSRAGRAVAWAARPITATFDRGLDAIMTSYPVALRWALRAPWTVLATALIAFLGSLVLAQNLGVDLIPSFSQGEFSFQVELPEGTPLESTDRFVQDVQKSVADDARVDAVSSIIGGAGLSLSNTGSEGENAARIQVPLKRGRGREAEEAVAAILRARLESSSIARYKFERPSYFTFRTPIEVEGYGDNLADLESAAAALKREMGTVS